MGDSKPFILSAVNADGKQLMVKLLKIDPDALIPIDERRKLIAMEIAACEILKLSKGDRNVQFIEADVIRVPIDAKHSPDEIQAIVMPKYLGTVSQSAGFFPATILQQGHEILRALQFIHTCNLVHMDVKGDNVFIDATGKWLLGDFGSCRPIGEDILSTTDMFYISKLVGAKAHPKYDFFMLLVMLLIESLPNKHDFEYVLCNEAGSERRVSLSKIRGAVEKVSFNVELHSLFLELLSFSEVE